MTDQGSTLTPPGKIAVAISGGGYRATAWGLGVLWCLADAGLNDDVTMIASVSGGSLANAHAGLGKPYGEQSADEFGAGARSLSVRLAGSVGGWRLCLIASVVVAIAGAVFAGRDDGRMVALAAAVLIIVAVAGALTSGDLLFGRVETWLYVDVLLACVWLIAWMWPNAVAVVGGVVLLAVLALLRGPVVGWSMGRSLRTLTGGGDTTLGALNAEPLHVFLATELRAGHHACFARDFVYCYDLGLGARPSLPVRTAVQASANLPGAFPTRWVRTSGVGFVGGDNKAGWMALSDGGVYDNMADQWPIGLDERINRLAKKTDVQQSPAASAVLDDWRQRDPDFVIVANASGALGYRKVWKGALPLLGELLGLLQVKDVLYDNGNSVRRRQLIRLFDAAGPAGTLVHIASNPYTLPGQLTDPARTAAARKYLEDNGGDESDWTAKAKAASGAGTQLWPLGTQLTRDIVTAAYAQTAVNLHVKCGTPLHPPPTW
jgi:predicted acylesterase/phospholipase RssA